WAGEGEAEGALGAWARSSAVAKGAGIEQLIEVVTAAPAGVFVEKERPGDRLRREVVERDRQEKRGRTRRWGTMHANRVSVRRTAWGAQPGAAARGRRSRWLSPDAAERVARRGARHDRCKAGIQAGASGAGGGAEGDAPVGAAGARAACQRSGKSSARRSGGGVGKRLSTSCR